jgi:hypothetical protein
VTNPAIVGPLRSTATLAAAMKPAPPRSERTIRRARPSRVVAPSCGRGRIPVHASAATTGRASVQAIAATPMGENYRNATAVAG